jgi:peptidoglycan/LPS O-acetylase OafA/YrhL
VLIALAACIAGLFNFVSTDLHLPSFALAKLLLPTAGAYLVFWIASWPAGDSALARFVQRNDLSYGVYLFGWPMQQLCAALLHIRSPYLLFPFAAPCAYACALASWYLIERPCLRLKPGARAQPD